MKAKIYNMKQNSKCRLSGDRDETVNYISECNKVDQKAKRQDMTRDWEKNEI